MMEESDEIGERLNQIWDQSSSASFRAAQCHDVAKFSSHVAGVTTYSSERMVTNRGSMLTQTTRR
jgi:hypothetical protein